MFGKAKKSLVIRTGVDIQKFKRKSRDSSFKKTKLSKNYFYGIHVGRGGYWTKGLDHAVKLSREIYNIQKNFRLIVIGDCCTDDTEEIINNFKDKRILFINLENRNKRYPESIENHWFAGPVAAINRALEIVTADWISRIDDDDIWTDDHLEILLKHAISSRSEFVSSSYITKIKNKEILKNFENEKPPIGGVQTWLYIGYLRFFKANIKLKEFLILLILGNFPFQSVYLPNVYLVYLTANQF